MVVQLTVIVSIKFYSYHICNNFGKSFVEPAQHCVMQVIIDLFFSYIF